jgi:hypothetical protein
MNHTRKPVQQRKPNHRAGIEIPLLTDSMVTTAITTRQTMAIVRSFNPSSTKLSNRREGFKFSDEVGEFIEFDPYYYKRFSCWRFFAN